MKTMTLVLAFLALNASATAQRSTPWPPPSDLADGILATIDGEELPEDRFYARLARDEGASRPGAEALRQLIDTRLVETAMASHSIAVTDEDVDGKYAELARRIEEASGGTVTLEGQMKQSGVTPEQFRDQLRFLVGLEKLARSDFGLGDDENVPDAKLNLWMTQLRDNAGVEVENLSPGTVARTDDFEISEAELGREIARVTPTLDLVRLARTMVSEHLIDRAAAKWEIQVDSADLEREMEHREWAYDRTERYPGVPFDQFVEATQGASTEAILESESFRHQVLLKKVAAKAWSETERKAYFEEHRGRYGPLRKLQQLVLSTATGRSPEETRALAESFRKEAETTTDFDTLVRGRSEGPNRMGGGNLGFVAPAADLDPALLDAAFRLESGKISEPIRTRDGYVLLRVHAVRPAPSFEEVEELVLRDLARDWLREAQQAAKVLPDWVYPKAEEPSVTTDEPGGN